MQILPSHLAAGQLVIVRDEPWIVLRTETFDAVRVVHLRGTGEANQGQVSTVVSPFDRVDVVAPSTAIGRASRRRVLATAAAAIADATPWAECWTAAAAAIEIRAWQLEPAIAAVTGTMRLLLADHVGLGKTIQATLIVSELLARGLAARVLVLTPASLREQWADEMRTRFRLSPTVFDQTTLRATVAALPLGVNPWRTAPVIVSSIDLVKRGEVRAAVECVPFDVLVVDEAHHLTRGSDRAAIVSALARRTPWVVLLSATPHCGDDAAFEFLLGLGSTTGEPMVTFRRARAQASAVRRSRMLVVGPTAAERALLSAVEIYARAVGRHGASDGARLVAAVIARRAASSAEALVLTLRRRAALLAHHAAPEVQPSLPWDDEEMREDETDEAVLAMPGLSDTAQELTWLARLTELATACAPCSSKIAVIRRLLRRTTEPLLVFSEYRDVVQIVAARLSEVSSVAAIHGGHSARDRAACVRAFNTGRVRTLVATDAAGEGLNLHHRCRLVINLELPWMPRRLEQRIGRVDRLGQARRVHAIHLVHRGSFENTVIARLERRRTLAARRSGALPALETDAPAAARRRLGTPASAYARSDRRALYAPHARAGAARAAVLVHTASLQDDDGRVLEHLAVGTLHTIASPTTTSPALGRRVLRGLLAAPQLRHVLAHRLEQRRRTAAAEMAPIAARIATRIAQCLAALDDRRTDAVWQGSLFHRRADDEQVRCLDGMSDTRASLERYRDAASRMTALRTSAVRLAAAWATSHLADRGVVPDPLDDPASESAAVSDHA